MDTKIKLIILAGLVAIIVGIMAVFGSAIAAAQECNGTLSHPNPVILGETFNVSFFNGMSGWTGTALLSWNPVGGLVNLSANPTATAPFTTSQWLMNSTAPGSYNVSILVVNSITGENCTKNSSILIVVGGRPFLTMDIVMPPAPVEGYIAKSNVNFNVNVSNVGNDTATNVISYFIGQNVVPPSRNLGNITNGTSNYTSYTLIPLMCGTNLLEGKTQYNEYYFAEGNKTFNVSGSDIALESFSVSDNSVREGETVTFRVNVTNVARNTSINATGVVVRVYRQNQLLVTINLGSVAVGETKSGSDTWEASGRGTFTPRIVVDSNEECGNWNNNFTSPVNITITGTGGGGGGGGGGSPGPICGNGLCEYQENIYCPQDCQQQNQTNQTNQTNQSQQPQGSCTPLSEDLIETSDDGLASLKVYKGTQIKIDGRCMEPGEVISLRADAIPYPAQNFYLVRAYLLLPSDITFDKDAEIKIRYNEYEVSESANAFIITYSPSEGRWLTLASVDDKDARVVTAKVSHFSSVALASTEKPPFTGLIIWHTFIGWASGNWWIILIVVVVIAAAAIFAHLMSRR
ncbi:MAG: hypothetical protein ACPLXC_00535 [Candidatus Pacearchaeota archaeon]